MKMEKEITVLVKSDYNTLKKALEMREFKLKDDYMVGQDINLFKLSHLEILQKCILVRNVVNIDKMLLYKYKKMPLMEI